MNKIVIELLKKRGIESDADIEEFLSDTPRHTYDPFLLSDMRAGVDLILDAVKSGRKICIYGDYDTDGVTATCIMYTALSRAGADVSYFLPSRFRDGYGMNNDAVDRIKAAGADVLITVDCGCTSLREVTHARDIGLDVVVTDHHTIAGELPDCPVINPHRKDQEYPFEHLAGCGTAYKFVQAMQRKGAFGRDVLREVLDLAAIGTVADIVPLTDENRTIVKYGLKEIYKRRRPGIAALTDVAGIKWGTNDSHNIGFGISPRINACGRLREADIAAELLMSDSEEDALHRAEEVNRINSERKTIQNETEDKCLELEQEQCGGSLFPIIYAEDAHEGITGIVAGRMTEDLGRPVSIVTPAGGGKLKGTARSIDAVDLYKVLDTQRELFDKFGGHRGACGYTIDAGKLGALRRGVNEEMERLLSEDSTLLDVCRDGYDIEISPDEVTVDLARSLSALEPYGEGNEAPVFRIAGIDPRWAKRMGADGRHLSFIAGYDGGRPFRCIDFNASDEEFDIAFSGRRCVVYGKIIINEFNGRVSPEIEAAFIEPEK
ncbi:MAG: single-stranded-DNA-specific exonuclease RecJ [Anaerovoracaceae bacterium]|nr:single-stranded-DNA-specific exonuclease RecJ [Anaerovoracaceae bacterium]